MKNQARFVFHSELQDFIETEDKNRPHYCQFDDNPSVKDLIESRGVPHTEVAAIVVNGESVDFTHQVHNGDNIDVYPITDITTLKPLRRLIEPLRSEPRFVLDVHLGALARYLRLAGFDVIYEKKDPGDEWIAACSAKQDRILVTRDKGLLKRAIIRQAYWLRSTHPAQQMRELVQRYHLVPWFHPFKRCTHCNGLVQPVEKASIESRLPDHVRRHVAEFRQCSQCQHLYWKGSHYSKIENFLAGLQRS